MTLNNNGPLIVGFGHRRRMGKDTLADLVWKRLVHAKVKPTRDAFARRLKKAAFRMFEYGSACGDYVGVGAGVAQRLAILERDVGEQLCHFAGVFFVL